MRIKEHKPIPEVRPLASKLQSRLQYPLPGENAHLELSSMRKPSFLKPAENSRQGGVLLLMYPFKGKVHLVFMKRTQDGRVHGGQISFPGGRKEPADPDLTFTALREAEEELGIPSREVTVLGNLTELYIYASNFRVIPTIGYLPYRPNFIPSELEVDEIIEVELDYVLQPAIIKEYKATLSNQMQIEVPGFHIGKHVIWGATAMMLNEFLHVVREIR